MGLPVRVGRVVARGERGGGGGGVGGEEGELAAGVSLPQHLRLKGALVGLQRRRVAELVGRSGGEDAGPELVFLRRRLSVVVEGQAEERLLGGEALRVGL